MNIEILKVTLSVITPLTVAVLGWLINQRVKRIEERQWFERKVVERRLDLYDSMAPGLNDILCFFCAFGSFRDITPPQLVSGKRALDRSYHLGKYLMSKEWNRAYASLVDICFVTNNAAGADAKILASEARQRRERGGRWPRSWSICFAEEQCATDQAEVAARYETLMKYFARDLGVPDQETYVDSRRSEERDDSSMSGMRSKG